MGHIGMSISEKLMDKGYDVVCCIDDLSKHSKSYRQISLIIGKIPSRDAFPSDIFNVHSSLLERCGKMNSTMMGGSITGFPIIETINSDITEFIATNVISITDGQIYMNKKLFNDSIRPAIDSALSVSRIGSSAQCKLMKLVSSGIKNRVTTLRNSDDTIMLRSYNSIFYQDHLFAVRYEITMVLLLASRNHIIFTNRLEIHRYLYLLASSYLILYYIIFITKSYSSALLLSFIQHYVASLSSSVFSR